MLCQLNVWTQHYIKDEWHEHQCILFFQANCKRRYFVQSWSHWEHTSISSCAYRSMHWLFAHHRGISLKWMSRYCSLILLLGLAALPWWCNSGRWCALQGWSLCRLDLSTAVRLVEAAFVSYFVFRIRERHVVNIIYMCIYCAWAELLSYSAGPCAASLGQLTCGNEGEVLLYHFVHLSRQPSNRRPTF